MNYDQIVISAGNNTKYSPVLTKTETAPIIQRAKEFEIKLTTLGADEFVKRHKAARERELAIFVRAQFCVTDRNPLKDGKFATPKARFDYLLKKARKYQQEGNIRDFETQVAEKYEEDVAKLKTTVENLSNQLDKAQKDLKHMLQDKGSIVREKTLDWMNKKLKDLEQFYRESQEISDYHKEVEEEIKNGQLP